MTAAGGAERCGLVVRDVSHAYGRQPVLDQVDLAARRGEVHCLLGPSGSGKSTLLRLVAGLEPLQRGSIWIAGIEVASSSTDVPPERRSVGFVFQDYALFPHLDVLGNVAFGLSGVPRQERRRAALRMLEQLGLGGFVRAMPHTLSGGQQQRVALARALVRDPAVMLLDEPFSGLDAQLRGEVRDTTLRALRAADTATLIVTHDPGEALLVGDLVSVIRGGRILQSGTPDQLYRGSLSREVAEVFGPVNVLPGEVRSGRVATPWGPLDAPRLGEGTQVEVLVRPESLLLSSRDDQRSVAARIIALVPEAGLQRATVSLAAGAQQLVVRDFRRRDWQIGESVFVEIVAREVIIVATARGGDPGRSPGAAERIDPREC